MNPLFKEDNCYKDPCWGHVNKKADEKDKPKDRGILIQQKTKKI